MMAFIRRHEGNRIDERNRSAESGEIKMALYAGCCVIQ